MPSEELHRIIKLLRARREAAAGLDVTVEGVRAALESASGKAAEDPMLTPEHMRTLARWVYGETDPAAPELSPLYADLRGLPPLLMQVGTAELLLDDTTRLAARAEAAGVDVTPEVWDDMFHVWQWFGAMLPEAREAVDRLGAFITARTA